MQAVSKADGEQSISRTNREIGCEHGPRHRRANTDCVGREERPFLKLKDLLKDGVRNARKELERDLDDGAQPALNRPLA